MCIKLSKYLPAKYYQDNKERLQIKACKRYQNLSKEKKKQQYGREHYKNLSENEKNKLVEYRKNITEWEKPFIIFLRNYVNLENFASL